MQQSAYLHVLCDGTYKDPLVYMINGRRVFDRMPISEYEAQLKAEGWELAEHSNTNRRLALVFTKGSQQPDTSSAFIDFFKSFLAAPKDQETAVVRAHIAILQTLDFAEWAFMLADIAKTESDMAPSATGFLAMLEGVLISLSSEDPKWTAVRTCVAHAFNHFTDTSEPFEFECALFLDKWTLTDGDENPSLIADNFSLIAQPAFATWLTERIMVLATAPQDEPHRNFYLQYIAALGSYLSPMSRTYPDLQAAATATDLTRQLITYFSNAFFSQFFTDLVAKDAAIIERWRTIIVHPDFEGALLRTADSLLADDDYASTIPMLKSQLEWFGDQLAKAGGIDTSLGPATLAVYHVLMRLSAAEVPFFRSLFTRKDRSREQ